MPFTAYHSKEIAELDVADTIILFVKAMQLPEMLSDLQNIELSEKEPAHQLVEIFNKAGLKAVNLNKFHPIIILSPKLYLNSPLLLK